MRFIRVTLTATDTPATIASLATLTEKSKFISRFIIYAEDANNVDATNGPARIGGSDVDRVAAGGVKGIPLLPGILYDEIGGVVTGGGVYSFEHIYLTGQSGDVFQIGYSHV